MAMLKPSESMSRKSPDCGRATAIWNGKSRETGLGAVCRWSRPLADRHRQHYRLGVVCTAVDVLAIEALLVVGVLLALVFR